ncbi:TPA: GNAT family N-acetyltransferase [Legionella pneumophila]|uniref:GNAT family N-acetyltransferase n=1 Tax=Legionella pneumophila TaxID=446 RepID=UPI001F019ACE|nr:GNAT family N-acetyltransferase [Legionella pneumophila]
MARFYVYDRTKYLRWECPETGMFECIYFKHYFEEPEQHAFLVKIDHELAGFVLLDKTKLIEKIDWSMGEFFILAKFQSNGIGGQAAREIFSRFLGKWSVAVMPENLGAVKFWRKIINEVSKGEFTEVFKTEKKLTTLDNPDPYAMIIFSFNAIHSI